MSSSGGLKLATITQMVPGASATKTWNNADAEAYCLSALPVVVPGATASAEIMHTSYVVHGNPSERELHFTVKNNGSTTINVDVWAVLVERVTMG